MACLRLRLPAGRQGFIRAGTGWVEERIGLKLEVVVDG